MFKKKDEVKKTKKAAPVNEDLEKLISERGEYLAGWQRALADYKNLQENMNQERQQALRLGEENILEAFLPVLENFAKATSSQTAILQEIREKLANDEDLLKKINNWEMGVQYINKQFSDLFQELGLQKMESVGQSFDPQFHDAVETASDSNFADNVVLKELQNGYIFKDKIIRAAKVVVNHLPTEPAAAAEANK